MLLALLKRVLGNLRGRPRVPTAEPAAGRGSLSFVVCSIDEARFARLRSNLETCLAGHDWELIRIADARSLAEGYNRGLARSRGDFVVFCHDDIELLQPDAAARLLAALRTCDVVGVAGSTRLRDSHWISAGTPHIHGQVVQPEPDGSYVLNVFCRHAMVPEAGNIQALDGLFIAARRGVAEALRFDAVNFDGFHLYDLDFSFRAHRAGYRVGVCHDLLIYHQSTGNKDEVWRRYGRHFEDCFAGRLSTEAGAPAAVYQLRLADKSQAAAAFQSVMEGVANEYRPRAHDNSSGSR